MKKIKALKEICKTKAAEIRAQRKSDYADPNWRGERWTRLCMGQDFRRHHVAYCLLRGTTYEQIEPKTTCENKLSSRDWETIEKIKTQFTEVQSESLCADAG